MIQYMRWSCYPSCFISVNMCFCHVSLQSRWMPRYLAVSLCGICCPFNVTAGQVSLFKEKAILVDLFPLAFMRHRFSHFYRRLRWCWRFAEAVMGFSCKARIAVSSAYVAVIVCSKQTSKTEKINLKKMWVQNVANREKVGSFIGP